MSTTNILSGLRILTVEDSTVIAERLKAMLTEIDNISFLGNASNIAEAIYLINQQEPDVIILDIHLKYDMPKANGIDLLIMLKESYKNVKVIMLTNLNLPQYKKTCIELGADYFMDKSNDFEKIPELIIGLSKHQIV
jgi:DNA-binding NarL/FixJ family response regulator